MTDAIIIGGGIAGLSAAYRLSLRGIRCRVLEARSRLGGLVGAGSVGGIKIDLGAESYALRSGEISRLCSELGLTMNCPQGKSWIYHSGGATPIAYGIWGIPASWDDGAWSALTGEEYARARMDENMATDRIGRISTLAELVRWRCGQAMLEKMVAPMVGSIHSASPEKIGIDAIAPGLRRAIEETGSLIRGVKKLRGTDKPNLAQPVGGMHVLHETLAEKLRGAGETLTTRMSCEKIIAEPEGGFTVTARETDGRSEDADRHAAGHTFGAEKLVLATGWKSACRLLRGAFPEAPLDISFPADASPVGVTVVLRSRELDCAPRGSGLLVSADSPLRAKALTHYSEKWKWCGNRLRALHGPHTHALRISYGRAGEEEILPDLPSVLHDASALLQCTLREEDVIDFRTVRWGRSLLSHTPQYTADIARLIEWQSRIPNFAVTGAWIAGTGLGAVIPHALTVGSEL